jgi:dimethylargininase
VEGGDVLQIGRSFLVGLSSRTDAAGAEAFERLIRPFGYRVLSVPVHSCLHLKTASTALPDGSLLVNADWLDVRALREFELVKVPDGEPSAADILPIGDTVCIPAEHAETADLLRRRGFEVRSTPLSEFAKAEGGVTCLSLLFR